MEFCNLNSCKYRLNKIVKVEIQFCLLGILQYPAVVHHKLNIVIFIYIYIYYLYLYIVSQALCSFQALLNCVCSSTHEQWHQTFHTLEEPL